MTSERMNLEELFLRGHLTNNASRLGLLYKFSLCPLDGEREDDVWRVENGEKRRHDLVLRTLLLQTLAGGLSKFIT